MAITMMQKDKIDFIQSKLLNKLMFYIFYIGGLAMSGVFAFSITKVFTEYKDTIQQLKIFVLLN